MTTSRKNQRFRRGNCPRENPREKESVARREAVLIAQIILKKRIREHNSNGHLCAYDTPLSTFGSRGNLCQFRFNKFHHVILHYVKGRSRGVHANLNSPSHAANY